MLRYILSAVRPVALVLTCSKTLKGTNKRPNDIIIKPVERILAFVGSLHAIIENKGIVAMLIATIIPDNLIMHDIPKTK
jgi:hypothetical protein